MNFLMWVWYKFHDKNYDFDKEVYFVNFVLCESIDFTGVLSDFWFVNKLVLKCYFFIKNVIFGWVRLKLYSIMVWWDFWCYDVIFLCGVNVWKWRKIGVLSNSLPNSEMVENVWKQQICPFWQSNTCFKM